MDWELLHVFTSKADAAEEGRELDWEETTLHGEKVVPTTDATRPSAPRAALRRYPVVEGSISAVATPGYSRLEVVDVTDARSRGVPARDELYVERVGGDETNAAYIYVNPSREGDEIYVQYEYYPSGEPPKSCASEDRVYWTGPGAGTWFIYNGVEVKRGYVAPPAVDFGPAGDAVYSAGPDMFVHARRRSTVLRGFPAEARPKETLGYLAQAWAAAVGYSEEGVFFFGSQKVSSHNLVEGEVISYKISDRRPAAPTVEMNYPGGRVRAGEGPETAIYRNAYIESYAHALWTAERLRSRYEKELVLYSIETAGVKDVRPGDSITFVSPINGVTFAGTVKKVRIDLEAYTTVIELVGRGIERKTKCQGLSSFPAE